MLIQCEMKPLSFLRSCDTAQVAVRLYVHGIAPAIRAFWLTFNNTLWCLWTTQDSHIPCFLLANICHGGYTSSSIRFLDFEGFSYEPI